MKGTTNNPSEFNCADKAEPDEPKFTLLGRDPSAAIIVRMWAHSREVLIRQGKKPASDRKQIAEAREIACSMEKFAEEWAAKKRKN